MGHRLRFRRAGPEDAGILARWFNDSENMKFMSTKIRGRVHSADSILQDMGRVTDGSEYLWMVYLDDPGSSEAGPEEPHRGSHPSPEPVGHAGIDDIDLHDKRGEIFFLIGDLGAQGIGLGREIARFLMDHAFNHLGLNSLFATTTVENVQSGRILEAVGFTRIGIRREFHYLNGCFHDEVLYDITRSDYRARRGESGSR